MAEPITLPFPPSVNALRTVRSGRMITSKPYRQWVQEAGLTLLQQRPERHKGPVAIVMDVVMPDKRRRDLDNLFKPVLDLLVSHQIIQRDDAEYVRALSVNVAEGFEGVRLRIEPFLALARP